MVHGDMAGVAWLKYAMRYYFTGRPYVGAPQQVLFVLEVVAPARKIVPQSMRKQAPCRSIGIEHFFLIEESAIQSSL